MESLAGVVGGLGLFIFGMRLLTENLKALANRKFRRTTQRWTSNRFAALVWGTIAGGITQGGPATPFLVVSLVRARLITMSSALAIILGGAIGGTGLVVIVTFDVKAAAFYVMGLSASVLAIEKLDRYRTIAGSFLGGAMIIVGLILLREAAVPLAEEPWFRELLEGTGESLVLSLLTAAALTLVVQSSGAVSIFGISLASVGIISVNQAIMTIYGSYVGAIAILAVLSANMSGRSRQVMMFLLSTNSLICAIVVPLLYAEIHFGVPSIKAMIDATGFDLPQRLALVYVITSMLPVPFMFFLLDPAARILERLWPESEFEGLSRPQFIHDRAMPEMATSLALADLEQRRAFRLQLRYFEHVREGRDIRPLREASRALMAEIDEFLKELQPLPMRTVEYRNALLTRQRLLTGLADAVDVMCGALLDIADRPKLEKFRDSMCEGVDSVFLILGDTLDSDDDEAWTIAHTLSGGRGEIMRKMRGDHMKAAMKLDRNDLSKVFLITNTVEDVFVLLSKLEADFNPHLRSNGKSPLT